MQYEQGRVSHAVAGCMRSLLQDWHLMVTQLEHQLLTGHLTLQVSPDPRQALPMAPALTANVTDIRRSETCERSCFWESVSVKK